MDLSLYWTRRRDFCNFVCIWFRSEINWQVQRRPNSKDLSCNIHCWQVLGRVIVSRFVHGVVPRFYYPRSIPRFGGNFAAYSHLTRCSTLWMLCHVELSKVTLMLHFSPNFPKCVWQDEKSSESEACLNVTEHTNATEPTYAWYNVAGRNRNHKVSQCSSMLLENVAEYWSCSKLRMTVHVSLNYDHVLPSLLTLNLRPATLWHVYVRG